MCNIKETLARFAKDAIDGIHSDLSHLVKAIVIILALFGKDV